MTLSARITYAALVVSLLALGGCPVLLDHRGEGRGEDRGRGDDRGREGDDHQRHRDDHHDEARGFLESSSTRLR